MMFVFWVRRTFQRKLKNSSNHNMIIHIMILFPFIYEGTHPLPGSEILFQQRHNDCPVGIPHESIAIQSASGEAKAYVI